MLLKTDLLAKDKKFLDNLDDLLQVTDGLQLDQLIVDNMLLGLEKVTPCADTARFKVQFVEALFAERKFFINMVRSLLQMINKRPLFTEEIPTNETLFTAGDE